MGFEVSLLSSKRFFISIDIIKKILFSYVEHTKNN